MSPELTGFLMVLGAGLSTGVGSAFVFSPRLIKLASRHFLAGSLGFSAGVMMYVSFVEILVKSKDAFIEDGTSEGNATLFSTLCFFSGIMIMGVLDMAVHKLEGQANADISQEFKIVNGAETDCVSRGVNASNEEVDEWQRKAQDEISESEGKVVRSMLGGGEGESKKFEALEIGKGQNRNEDLESTLGDKKLVHMGLATALSIAIHNFPEGLATYVGAVLDPAVGATMAIAIAIHNIPEGLCVSIPIYYATGNKAKAFTWGLLSGITEPIGAFAGWAILMNSMSQVAYGVLFGLVAGMMVRISVKELMPTAYRYDPADSVVTNSFIAGMVVMALSLVLFVVV
jgi:ZIP family zinc transporter